MAAIGSLYGRYRMGKVLLGLDYIPSNYWVNAEEYMLRQQFRPQATWNASKYLITKLSLDYFINDNRQDDERDGDSADLLLDGYILIPGIKGVVLAGLGYEDYNTDNLDYSYNQLMTKLGLSLTPFWDINVNLTGKFYSKDFDDVDSSYLVKREDSKYSWSLSLARHVYWDWLSVLLEYEYTDNESNIDTYTYKRNVTVLSLSASF